MSGLKPRPPEGEPNPRNRRVGIRCPVRSTQLPSTQTLTPRAIASTQTCKPLGVVRRFSLGPRHSKVAGPKNVGLRRKLGLFVEDEWDGDRGVHFHWFAIE
jgi:hypothetical protein